MTAISYQHLSLCCIPPQIPDQQPCADIEASCFRGGLMWLRPEEGRDEEKYERRKDGRLSSRGQHNSLITSHLSSISSSHPRCPKQPANILGSFFIFFTIPFPLVLLCPISPFRVLNSLPILLSSLFITYWPSLCHSLCLYMESMKTNVTPSIRGIYFPAKVNLPPCNKDRSSVKRTERWRERTREEDGKRDGLMYLCTIIGWIRWHDRLFSAISSSVFKGIWFIFTTWVSFSKPWTSFPSVSTGAIVEIWKHGDAATLKSDRLSCGQVVNKPTIWPDYRNHLTWR